MTAEYFFTFKKKLFYLAAHKNILKLNFNNLYFRYNLSKPEIEE